ncbi:MAG TPA: hypothetical protein VGL04_03215, partial [Sporichthyaceae bacterium]
MRRGVVALSVVALLAACGGSDWAAAPDPPSTAALGPAREPTAYLSEVCDAVVAMIEAKIQFLSAAQGMATDPPDVDLPDQIKSWKAAFNAMAKAAGAQDDSLRRAGYPQLANGEAIAHALRVALSVGPIARSAAAKEQNLHSTSVLVLDENGAQDAIDLAGKLIHRPHAKDAYKRIPNLADLRSR